MLLIGKRSVRMTRPRKRKKTRIRLQPRDDFILRKVAERRLLRRSHIVDLVLKTSQLQLSEKGSEQGITRRLQHLREHGILDGIEPEFGDRGQRGKGSNPRIYALGYVGAEVAREHLGIWQSPRMTDNNRELTDTKILHDLALSDFMVQVELQCEDHPGTEFISFYDILKNAPDERREAPRPRSFPVTFEFLEDTYTRHAEPDDIFGVRNLEKQGRAAFFAPEVDRATETVVPRKLKTHGFMKPTILRKTLEYGFAWKQGLPKEYFGVPSFRPIFITSTIVRVNSFIDVHQRFTRPRPLAVPSALFLYTYQDMWERHGNDLLSLPFLDGAHRKVTLLD